MAKEKVVFYRSDYSKDVVIKPSDYGAKLKADDRVMYPLEESTTDPKHTPVIKHVVMNTWEVSVPNHPVINLHYIDWIAVETTLGFHFIQIGPKTEPVATFCLSKGEKILKAFAYCVPNGLFCTVKSGNDEE